MVKDRIISFGINGDDRGSLVAIESGMPIEIKRVFYIYGVPEGKMRAGHSHENCTQVLIAVSGKLDVVLYDLDSSSPNSYTLYRPQDGFIVYPGETIFLENFSKDCVLLVLASEHYEDDVVVPAMEVSNELESSLFSLIPR